MAENPVNKAASAAKSTADKARSTASAVAGAAPTSAKDASEKVKNAAYTLLGLGVMGLNKVQAQARQMAQTAKSKDLSDHLEAIKTHAGTVAKATTDTVAKADKHVEATITKVEEKIQPLEDRLPAQARDLSRRARETGRETRAKLRSKVVSS